MTNQQVLCIWLPNWPVQRFLVENNRSGTAANGPERVADRGPSLILFRNHPQRGQLVVAASQAAVQCGVRIEMPLSEAKSLAARGSCEPCWYEEYDPASDRAALQALALGCEVFSPLVGLEQAPEPSSIFLSTTGLAHLFGGLPGMQRQIVQHFQQRGYAIRTAVASTLGMAWGLARYGGEGKDDAAGTGVDCPDRASDEFSTLPVAALRLDELTLDTLQQLGITHVAQLARLPRAGLRSRFGDEILRRLDQASGSVEEIIVALERPSEFSAEQVLDYPVSDRETVEVILSGLASGLCEQMRRQQCGGLQWLCDLRGPATPPVQLNVNLFQPTANLRHLMSLVHMQLDQLQFSSRGAAKRGKRKRRRNRARSPDQDDTPARVFAFQEFKVCVTNSVLLTERQRELFDETPHLDREALSHLINRLSSRLGHQCVLSPRVQRGAQVECAGVFQPLVEGDGRRASGMLRSQTRRTKQNRSQHAVRERTRQPGLGQAFSPLQRPLRLFPEPIELSGISLTGQHWESSRIPAKFTCAHQSFQVLRRWGPERIETAWWLGSTIRRDYWRIESSDQRWLWIYRDLNTRRWFWHGEF